MEVPPPAPRSFPSRAPSPFLRVFAADKGAAESEAPAEHRKLPSYIPGRSYPESGWDRLRELFLRDEEQRISKELENIYRATLSAGIIGWAYGGIPAFVHAKQQYIEQSQAQIYHNRFDAVQSAHRAATRGFIRYGWRWSWRTALFVTIFNTVNTSLNVYRNENALSHFVIAGAVTGGIFRINLGLRGLVAGGVFGALLGTPLGGLVVLLQTYCGETLQERKQKDRQALHDLQLEEWKARLQVTEILPKEIESSLHSSQTEDDAKKIEVLLNLPRNPSSKDKEDRD